MDPMKQRNKGEDGCLQKLKRKRNGDRGAENSEVQVNPFQPVQRMVGLEERGESTEFPEISSSRAADLVGNRNTQAQGEMTVPAMHSGSPRKESQLCIACLLPPSLCALYHSAPLSFLQKLGIGTDFKQYPTQITPQNLVLLLSVKITARECVATTNFDL